MTKPERACDCPARVVSLLRIGRPCPTCGGAMPGLDDIDRRILAHETHPAVRVREMRAALDRQRKG